MRATTGIAVFGMVGALVAVGAFAGCKGSTDDTVAPPAAPVDGRLPLGELTEPIDCPEMTACAPVEAGAFVPAFEAPENIELLPEQSGLVGYDHATKQFVAYSAWGSFTEGDAGPPRIDEGHRFDASYDRVQVGASQALACAGQTCDVVELFFGTRQRRLPDELSARWLHDLCVGGNGLVCPDIHDEWTWIVPAEGFDAPIAFFVELGRRGREFVVVDTKGATWLVLNGKVQPFDLGLGEPLIALAKTAGNWDRDHRQWMGKTASGKLVLGSLKRAHVCEGIQVDTIVDDASDGTTAFRQGRSLVVYSDKGCWKQELPPDVPGVGYAHCGLARSLIAFDRHRVVAEPIISCPID